MNLPGRFFWKVFLGHAVLAVCVLAAGLLVLVSAVKRIDVDRTAREQEDFAKRIAKLVEGRLDPAHREELQRIATSLGTSAIEGVRITLILPDGTVLADSQGDPATMDSHADRPEVIAALKSGTGRSVRWSNTVARHLSYTALRVGPYDHPAGTVRVAVIADANAVTSAALRSVLIRIMLIGAFVIGAAAFALAAHWRGRIDRITHAARAAARGDLTTPADARGHDEFALLARLLNRLRKRVSRQLEDTERQRRTVESILSKLGEGVVVATHEGRVMMMNDTARTMLGVNDNASTGLGAPNDATVERCVPHHELQQLLLAPENEQAALSASPVEVRLASPDGSDERIVLAHTSSIELAGRNARKVPVRPIDADADPPPHPLATGRLLVLTDVTALTKSVRLKTDFVAHASHELRTPLTAIRGAIETLMHMDLAAGDPSATRFLEIIGRHSKRLEAMAADLLALARLEAGSKRFEPTSINLYVLRDALYDQWREALDRRGLAFTIDMPSDSAQLAANPYLINLVLDNLIENASKFTEPGGRVVVTVAQSANESTLSVADTGCGIAEEEQSRVFERFYQASQARAVTPAKATTPRGTGLGLSIVRHAVAALNGSVELQSEVGKGTTVVVRLPQPARDRTST